MDKGTIILNVYSPPPTSGNQRNFLDHLSQTLEVKQTDRYADTYLLGDFNLDHMPRRMTETGKNLLNMMKSLGISQIIKAHMWITVKSQTILDVVYVKQIRPSTLSFVR